jgi:WD40 repeat protein
MQRRIFTKNNLTEYVPIVIANLISEYDYYFNGKCELTLKGHNDEVTFCFVLPNEQKIQRIVSGSNDDTIKIWSAQTDRLRCSNPEGNCELTIEGNFPHLKCCDVLPDGRIILEWRYNTVNMRFYRLYTAHSSTFRGKECCKLQEIVIKIYGGY